MNTSIQFLLPFADISEEQMKHFPLYQSTDLLESLQRFVEYQFSRIQAHEQKYQEKYLQKNLTQNELDNYKAYIVEDQIVGNSFLEILSNLIRLQDALTSKKQHTRFSTLEYLREWQNKDENELPADKNVLNGIKGRRSLKQATVEAFIVRKKLQLDMYDIDDFLIKKFGINDQDPNERLNLYQNRSTCKTDGILKEAHVGFYELNYDSKLTQKYLHKIKTQ